MSKKFIDFYREAVTQKAAEGGGGEITKEALSVSENGVYTAPSGKAYSPVTVNVPQKENLFLPDESDGYTEYEGIADLTVSDIRNAGIGSTFNVKIAKDSGIVVNDKVLLTGTIQNSGADVVTYAVWGTVNYYHDYTTYSRIRFVVVGSSIRTFTGDTVSISSNGNYDVYGASEVNVNVEALDTTTLYATENGDYFPDSGYAYSEVHVDVQGGSEPVLQSKAVTVTQNGTEVIEPDSGYDGLSNVEVTVDVPTPTPSVQSKAVTITQNGTTHITPDSGYDGLDDVAVTVNVSGSGGGTDEDLVKVIARTISGSFYHSGITSIGKQAFAACSKLTAVDLPNCSQVTGPWVFSGCSSLSKITMSSCVTVSSSAFTNLSGLEEVDFPACTNVMTSAFASCSKLSKISFPALQYASAHAFISCTSLKEVELPNALSLYSSAFAKCSNLEMVSLPRITAFQAGIGTAAAQFNFCSKLMSVYLLGSSVPTATPSIVFYSTPIMSSGYTGSFGSIFVMPSMVEAFKTATNWAAIADRITAYEG